MPRAQSLSGSLAYRPHPHLYEINTWPWLEGLSAAAGRRITLGSVPDAEWDRLAALGFDFVWLMGVWQRSPAGRLQARTDPGLFRAYDEALPGWTMEHVAGSAYSVQAYRPDPRIGTWEELDAVRAKLHERGMGLILDFVTNHTGPDHQWVSAHPEYFVQGTQKDFRQNPAAFLLVEGPDGRAHFIARGRDPFFPPWPDTAQLNYFNSAARQAILEELGQIARHCDGLRCDMAMLVLNDVFESTWRLLLPHDPQPREEFWPQAVAALPGFVWIAEVYWDLEWRMQNLGFQFTYDKRLMDRLHSGATREVRDHLRADREYQGRLVRFLENHDEPRSAAALGIERLPALAPFISTLPGMRFYYDGQLEARRIRPPVHLGVVRSEPPNAETRALYEKVLRIADDEVFHQGTWRLRDVEPVGDGSFENLIAYEWRLEGDWRLIVVNLGGTASQGKVHLSDAVETGQHYIFTDQLSGTAYPWEGHALLGGGLFVRLEANRAHLFHIRKT